MPHNNFKMRSRPLNSEVVKCTCGQTFDFTSERDRNMKLQLHCQFCPKPPESSKQVRIQVIMKGMTLREQQHYEVERLRRVSENH